LTKTTSGRFRRFNWEMAYAMWGMKNLHTCTHWYSMIDGERQLRYGEDRKWLKMEERYD